MKETIMSMVVLITILSGMPEKGIADPAIVHRDNQDCLRSLNDNLLTDSTEDEQVLLRLVEETYVNGALNRMDVAEMRRGFHPDFAILIAKNQDLTRLALSDWMQLVEAYKSNPEKVGSGIRNLDHSIRVVAVTGNTAIVELQFFRSGELVITDYLSYLKYPEGWLAVAKVSHEHIVNPLQLDFK
ncbi:nuclear transport factor 2 family protein [Sphingobacterium tabacisoli]|uniref:Nuclear transport factor 2 family protein n=1 Tax=Sphingobacterium tabacisoli TaxID=2044855 RepID=A0ABW5L4G5_9SPHI|nr:nuclear transport factor 2 family protein [Sphingobacterium tabacisoli]